MTPQDLAHIKRAIELAELGRGHTSPNPLVGALVVRDEEVLGEGYHAAYGSPHAEVAALSACTTDPIGATMYVTLEPCSHHGKTPPCADAIVAAGLARVVPALTDPNPEVSSVYDRMPAVGPGRQRVDPLQVGAELGRQAAGQRVAVVHPRPQRGVDAGRSAGPEGGGELLRYSLSRSDRLSSKRLPGADR